VRWVSGVAVLLGLAVPGAGFGPGGAAPAAGANATSTPGSNWSEYLGGLSHHSYQAGATAITPTNADSLKKAWHWMPDSPPIPELGEAIVSSPTVVDGVVYVGANNGNFYAIDESTGAVIWKHVIGYSNASTNDCGHRGFTSTADVVVDPADSKLEVYVAGADGYLYDLDAATGATVWKSVIGISPPGKTSYYNWASPAVSHGTVYMGISSQCDHPLVRGGVLAFDQSTGAKVASFYTVPQGAVGGSVWSSPAVSSNGTVFVTTGNGPSSNPSLARSISVIALDGKTLARLDSWKVPRTRQSTADSDFGGSPTLFSAVLPGDRSATPLVGACNKNDVYYVWKQNDLSAGPVWSLPLAKQGSSECVSAAAFDGRHLFLPVPNRDWKNTPWSTPLREVDPATGKVVWSRTVLGGYSSPSLDGAGVLAFPSYETRPGARNYCYLIKASTGALLAKLGNGNSLEFAQAVFAGQYVFVASMQGGLTAYRAPS
jgi:outer membrane protein assembly factor BamB